MKRLAFALCLLVCALVPARSYWQSRTQVSIAAPAGYTGPGDIVSGASAWWGLRGYNTAYTGNVADVCDVATGLVCATITWSGTALVIPTIGGIACNNSTNICVIAKLYDQTGNGFHLTGLGGSRPTLTFNCVGTTNPCMTFNGTTNGLNNATGFSIAVGATVSFVANSTNTGGQQNGFAGTGSAAFAVGYRNSANNQVFAFQGAVLTATASDGSWHALQGVFNDTSSDMNVDGTPNAGAAGNQTCSGCANYQLGIVSGSQFFKGTMVEAGYWGSTAFSSGQSSSMSSNQHAFWGF